MPRIRQQYWFCLAGICLVGSFMVIWSPGIEVLEEVTSEPAPIPANEVVRRLSDLPQSRLSAGLNGQTIPQDHMPWEPSRGAHSSLVVPLERTRPRVESVSPLPRTSIENGFTPASYQHEKNPQTPQPVWFSGRIEAASSHR